MKQKILLISHLLDGIISMCDILERFGMDVLHRTSTDGLRAELAFHSPAFILLDLDMKNSTTFLMEISNGAFLPRPFIMVANDFSRSAKRTAILQMGADACIGKPMNAEEVLAVICAVHRRERWIVQFSHSRRLPCIEYKGLMIDPFHRLVTMNGKPIALTMKEFDILYLLSQHSGTVLSKEEIYKTVWNTDIHLNVSIVTDHISSIRKKLGPNGKSGDYIRTVFGIGYCFGSLHDEYPIV